MKTQNWLKEKRSRKKLILNKNIIEQFYSIHYQESKTSDSQSDEGCTHIFKEKTKEKIRFSRKIVIILK